MVSVGTYVQAFFSAEKARTSCAPNGWKLLIGLLLIKHQANEHKFRLEQYDLHMYPDQVQT